MRSLLQLNILNADSATEVDISIAPPHHFAIKYQQQLLPDWKIPISYFILVLQQSAISLQDSTVEVFNEKERLRAEFIRFGRNLSFTLADQGHLSDLFDPRTGYPLLGSQEMTLDDNAVVKAILNYPLVSYQQCSLITHPLWNHHVYPGTIVTTACQSSIISALESAIASQNWQLIY